MVCRGCVRSILEIIDPVTAQWTWCVYWSPQFHSLAAPDCTLLQHTIFAALRFSHRHERTAPLTGTRHMSRAPPGRLQPAPLHASLAA